MAIKAWFPTFIYEAPLERRGGRAFRRALLEDCLKVRDHDRAGARWSRRHYPAGFTSFATMSRLHKTFSTFGELATKLDHHVRAFARHLDMDLEGRRLEMTDCWVNIMPRHAVHSLHFHPVSTISGTFYVRTPRGSSRLRFEDPRLASFMAAPPKLAGARPANRQQVAYDVEAGRVILFESWLRHEVAPSRIDGERVSVSFNYNWF
jgi:uncharacterized protein (TIGR02466 family)